MLQPRIMVGSRSDQQKFSKLKSNKRIALISSASHPKTALSTAAAAVAETSTTTTTITTTKTTLENMWSFDKSFGASQTNKDVIENDNCGGCRQHGHRRPYLSKRKKPGSALLTLNVYAASTHSLAKFLILAVILYSSTLCMAQLSDNNNKELQPTPLLNLDEQDVTTILLVDNNNRAAHGRFLNVKPAVGLLTSTARTFIQDGVTTEYATQVLGTTLDHGRLYAQLLTKSSRVVYSNSNNNVDDSNVIQPTTTVSPIVYNQVIHTQLIGVIAGSAKRSEQNDAVDHKNNEKTAKVANDDDNIVTFIKNTDYVSPNNPTKAYVVYPSSALHSFNYSRTTSADDVEFELLPQSLAQISDSQLSENARIRQSFSVSESSSNTKSNSNSKDNGGGDSKPQVQPDKVKSANELPTFTIPSGFTFDGIETENYDQFDGLSDSGEHQDELHYSQHASFSGSPQAVDIQQNRIGKQLYRGNAPAVVGIAEEIKHLTSVTYYGFADFTTIVGNTVIVFSPSTAPVNTGQITSIKGEATLHYVDATKSAQIKPTETVAKNIILQTKQAVQVSNAVQGPNRKSKADENKTTTTERPLETTESEELENGEVDVTNSVPTTTSYDENLAIVGDEQSLEELEQKSSVLAKEQNSLKYDLMPSVFEHSESVITATADFIEPSEIQVISASSTTKTEPIMLSIPSSDDIAKIFASLAARDKSLSITTSSEATKSKPLIDEKASTETVDDIQVFGGATTIFFEDDPFLLVASTSTTEIEISPSTTISNAKTVVATNEADNYTLPPTTEESIDTTSATATTESVDAENVDEQQPSATTENDVDVTSSTPLQSEDLNDESEENTIECPDGFTLKPSTVYKTLTYLTTFFIPTDDEEESTTTSIQSNDIVQTDVSYDCSKTSRPIEIAPTSIQQDSAAKTKLFGLIRNTEKPLEESTTIKEIPAKANLRNKLFNRFKVTTPTPPTTITTTDESVTENADVIEQIDENASSTTTENVQQFEGNTIEAITSSTSSSTTTESANDSDEDEIELIYKTLYTTYTYLTTFFHESTSSVSSRKEVVTNIVTSTLDMSLIKSDAALADLVASMSAEQGNHEAHTINPTKAAGSVKSTIAADVEAAKEATISIEDIFDDSYVESNLNQATPMLSDTALSATNVDGPDAKTYYTTYTYFTTIFVDGETEISSRTEVYTNFVAQSMKPTNLLEEDKLFATKLVEQVEDSANEIKDRVSEIGASIIASAEDLIDNNVIQPSYSTMLRASELSAEAVPQSEVAVSTPTSVDESATTGSNNDESSMVSISMTNSTMTTEVKNTISSNGARQLVENIRKRLNNLLEDQISSESNNEEIMPSPTLLLQTSYTTFTYFTTMYMGDASEVLSRLETVTNVVTETLSPTQTIIVPAIALSDDAVLPTTYFTTFTYWTTLYKEGDVVTTSREKIVSNVVSPSATTVAIEDILPTSRVESIETEATIEASPSVVTPAAAETDDSEARKLNVDGTQNSFESSELTPTVVINEPTTYFTTYTYFTTSYVGDETVLNSRFETVTNVLPAASVVPIGRAINLDKANANQIVGEKVEKKVKTKEQSAPAPKVSAAQPKENRENIVSLNVGQIVDAEGISTIFYTTKAIGTYIDNVYSQITDKTSTVRVDESKKKDLLDATPALTDGKPLSGQHKTGLVRLIDGTMIANHTTTLYQSKVIGTIIDNRYAQIIESTSSYVIEKTQEASISPSSTVSLGVKPTETVISPTSAVVESSLSDSHQTEEHDENYSDEEEEEGDMGEEGADEDENDDENDDGRKKSRLTFATKKRTFTPIIRPFASRNRPTFSPKRKNLNPSSATIITRSDFTPTITATPAIKAEASTRRFSGGSRRSSSNTPQAASPTFSASSSLNSSRRFSRVRTSALSSINGSPSYQSSIGPSGSARIRPSSVRTPQSTSSSNYFGSSSRRVGNLFRSSSLGARLSILPSQARFRPNPTLASTLRENLASVTVKSANDQDDTTTVEPTEDVGSDANEEGDELNEEEVPSTTTENSRRNQNPLLRFRRPLTSGASRFQPSSTPRPPPVIVSTRRSPILQRTRATQPTTTTTTPKPKAKTFPKPNPGLVALSNRPRAGANGLFPPRGLFKPTVPANQELEKDENNNVGNEHSEGEAPDNNDENVNDDDADVSYVEDSVDDEYDNRNRRENKSAAITPQASLRIRKRTKRQVDYGTRTLSRHRRPTQNQTPPQISARSYEESYDEVELPTQRPKPNTSRYSSRHRSGNSGATSVSPAPLNIPTINVNSNSRIRPTKASAKQGRAQFTLRSGASDKENVSSFTPTNSRTSNFRRNQNINSNTNSYVPPSSIRRKPLPTSASRQKTSRLRNYGGTYAADTRNSNSRSRSGTSTSSRGNTRVSPRSRSRVIPDNIDLEYVTNFGGTITVTHSIPTEVTIPFVNGQLTEYKNVITAKISTEILGPNQYSTTTRGLSGNTVLVLTSEATNLNNGATELTQFFLKETPTTSVTYTPTFIRGRKTSFSHIVPSTVYNVEPVVSTIQPQISANAPLANILLSQLLLGNLALPNQQQQLLGLGQQPQINQIAATPTTEYKTRTTTYVTTVTNAMSTVLPLTFHGKEILTTIVDSSLNVITATEFITDTVVVTPTPALAQPQQFNSLLLPLLLQQQAQQQQQQQQQQQPLNPLSLLQNTPTGIGNVDTLVSQSLFQDSLLTLEKDDRQLLSGRKKFDIDDNEESNRDDYPDLEPYENENHEQQQKFARPPSSFVSENRQQANNNKRKFSKLAQPTPPLETSVITLYVSGRKPGEFSTVLSTVVNAPNAGNTLLQKRAIDENIAVRASRLPDYFDVYKAEGSDIDEIIMPAATTNELNYIESSQSGVERSGDADNGSPGSETQSLETSLLAAASAREKDAIEWSAIKKSAAESSIASPIVASRNSHNTISTVNLSHPHNSKHTSNYQSRQRKHRSSHSDRRRDHRSVSKRNNNIKIVSKSNGITGESDDGSLIRVNNNSNSNNHANQLGFSAATAPADEARYNLATRIMSNGVEVIVAGDKSTLPGGHPNNHLRILTTSETFKVPFTLAPSTLKDHMLLMMPQSSASSTAAAVVTNTAANNDQHLDSIKNSQILNDLQLLNQQNQFVTKTCLTTYTYSTTYIKDGTIKIESREKVITNTATEERNAYRIQPTPTSGITLTQTPQLNVGIFMTTYTYLNTIMDGDQPLIVTSQHTVTNTITAPDDYLSMLQPSEPSATLFETNTYYNTMVLTKTLTDSDVSKVISTTDVVRQVVITELLPSKSTSVMTSYIAIDSDGNKSPAEKADILASPLLSATDVVKTYYVTYTYFNTYLVNGSTIVRTNVSTSSDIVTEKLYIYPTKRVQSSHQTTLTTKHAIPIRIESTDNKNAEDNYDDEQQNELLNEPLRQTINVYATKTFMTTFTYFTTLLQGPNSVDGSIAQPPSKDYPNYSNENSANDDNHNELLSTVINSHTRVVENVVTESIPMSFLPSTAIHKLKLMLFGDDKSMVPLNENKFTTVATLIGGQALEITAVKSVIDTTTSTRKDVEMQTASVAHSPSHDYNENSANESDHDGHGDQLTDVDDTKNELDTDDQDSAGTSDLEVLESGASVPSHSTNNNIDRRPEIKSNSTKIIKNTASPVSNLIGSLNFNGLKALRPMFDAVAGLINTNFRLNWNNDSVSSNSQPIAVQHHPSALPLVYTTPRPQGNLPPIPKYIENYTNINNQFSGDKVPVPLPNIEPARGQARNPIYIPVNGNKENHDVSTGQQLIENLTPNTISTPGGKFDKPNEVVQRNPNAKNKLSLLNGGIPISPGEVITANSDVIFGRPTGNRPRIPLNNKMNDKPPPIFDKTIPLGLLPPLNPPSAALQSTELHSDSHSISSIQNEAYIGPPPPHQTLSRHPKPLKHQQHVQHTSAAQLNKIPIFRNKLIFLRNNKPSHIGSVLLPHQVAANQNAKNRIRAQLNPMNKDQNRLIRPNVIPIKHVIQENGLLLPLQSQPSIQLQVQQNIPTPIIEQRPNTDMHQYVINNIAGGTNDIIEIQRIPEVFSTDLPPVHIYNAPQEIVSFTAKTIEPSQIEERYRPQQEIQTANQLPEVVESATGQPLFVNIQPSQIAKVIIPHGSSSALIYGGVQELHKSGEYFDDPSPYPNEEDQSISINAKPSVAVIENTIKHGISSSEDSNVSGSKGNLIFVKSHTPILSNQKINVDSHVLSQDVDMHAPPILFRNQETNSNDSPAQVGPYSNDEQVINGGHGNTLPMPPTLLDNSNFHEIEPFYSQNHQSSRPGYANSNNIANIFSFGATPQKHDQTNGNTPYQWPFSVDIQSINLGMSSENGGGSSDSNDSNVSQEVDDQSPIEHSQAPSVDEQVIDQHKDDDYENEQGEVIQESNAVPQLISNGQSLSDVSLNRIPNYAKPTTKTVEKDQRIPFTQTEANRLWDQYPSTTEIYTVSPSSEKTAVNRTLLPPVLPTIKQSTTNYRSPLNAYPNLPIPQIPPAIINDMYLSTRYRNQSSTPSSSALNHIRLHNTKHYFGQPAVEQRPPKFASVGTQQSSLVPLQHLRPPPQFPAPIFDNRHQHPRRPITLNQKPLIRGPVHYKPSIPTNYTNHIDQIMPNRQSDNPMDLNYFRPNTLLTTTKAPMPKPTEQIPQTSKTVISFSTQRPFTKLHTPHHVSESKVMYYSNIPTDAPRPSPTVSIYDPTRGKPFVVHHVETQHSQTDKFSSLNTGEVNWPAVSHKQSSNETKSDLDSTHDGSDIFDFKETINPHNFASLADTNAITTQSPLAITDVNAASHGYKNTNSISITLSKPLYPKAPATDMQPPPSYISKYKPYVQKLQIPSTPSPSTYHHNVLVEEVMGLHPPPPPSKVRTNLKHPEMQIQPNLVNELSMTSSYQTIRPTPSQESITVQTQFNKASAATHHSNLTNANYNSYVGSEMLRNSFEKPKLHVQSTTNSPELDDDEDVDDSDNHHLSYHAINRIKIVSKPVNPEILLSTTASALNEYVHFNIDSNDGDKYNSEDQSFSLDELEILTSMDDHSAKKSINGHLPHASQSYETLSPEKSISEEISISKPETYQFIPLPPSLLSIEPSIIGTVEPIQMTFASTPELHAINENYTTQMTQPSASIRTTSTTIFNTIEPTATLQSEELLLQPTKYITNTKTLTVTTTKTTVIRSQGVTTTLTLTLTKTQTTTIIDTITHTLLKPTRITYYPTIKPTIYTAPITMQKVSGSSSSIVPNPSFSIYANFEPNHDNDDDDDDDEHKDSNTSDDSQSFEIDEDEKEAPTTPNIQLEPTSRRHSNMTTASHNDSIFVVMTDRKKLGTININPDVLDTLTNDLLNGGGANKVGHISDDKDASDFANKHPAPNHRDANDGVLSPDNDEEDEFFDNLPKRDEDDITNDVSHVLLGGILIATPPRSSEVLQGDSTLNRMKNTRPHNSNNYDNHINEHLDHQSADSAIEESKHDVLLVDSNKSECQPECKATNNEVCHAIDGSARCVCRPGFARMFPDRPCKPTYTYTMHLAVSRLQSQSLKYEDALRNPSSPKYAHLVEIVHDAIDRMVMQSDLRDIYHGVQVSGFSNVTQRNDTQHNVEGVPKKPIVAADKGVEAEFYLQLSDNSNNEERLMDIFKKYLRNNNYNLGGTNLYSSQSLTDQIRANDFDECLSTQYHDCSENSYCFNLRGTYTCSCREGFADLSVNPIYPGRICSAELIGCERCNYHGTCYDDNKLDDNNGSNDHNSIDNEPNQSKKVCECFQWYAGENCQYNLKVLLVGLIALGGILFALLLICIILTCWKHTRPNSRRRTVVPGIDILPHKTLTVHGTGGKNSTLQDKRAMIEDTSSETSDDSCQLPYVAKKQQQQQQQQHQNQQHVPAKHNKRMTMNKPTSAPPKGIAPLPPKTNAVAASAAAAANTATSTQSQLSAIEQKNRSLTVMIPRAKYHSQQQTNGSHLVQDTQTQQQQHQHGQKQDAIATNVNRIVQTGAAAATSGNIAIATFTTDSIDSTEMAEAKLLSYLDASPSTTKGFARKKSNVNNNKGHINDDSLSHNLHHHYPFHSVETGALVSAGFEVSATVVHDHQTDANGQHTHILMDMSQNTLEGMKRRSTMDGNGGATTSNKKTTDHLLNSMVDWLTKVPENELIISEARSYGETMVQPQTKTLTLSPQHYRSQTTSIYDKPLSTIMMDEVDTMAERDLGSTFLLPHTHLYKPDRGSDISGFDSL